jgi:hypothetical protein
MHNIKDDERDRATTVVGEPAASSEFSFTFPVAVVARDGMNVVLSQGGQSVKAGARYAVVSMGKEIIDPQTQQSLGRMESPCCEVFVVRRQRKVNGDPGLLWLHLRSRQRSCHQLRLRTKTKSSNSPVPSNFILL